MQHDALPFLTAQWRDLAVANFEIDPVVLSPLMPAGTELDLWNGRALISMVGFQFRDTRLMGWSIPGHRNFPEVNLRFYVRRPTPAGWRRAVVFIKELAPRRLVAWTARWFYGENYATVPMQYASRTSNSAPEAREVTYRWTHAGEAYRLSVTGEGSGHLAAAGSEQEFVIEHYWAHTRRGEHHTIEYRVDHPRWRLWTASAASFAGDVASLYGKRFVEALSAPPASAFLAGGSEVALHRGSSLDLAASSTDKTAGAGNMRGPLLQRVE